MSNETENLPLPPKPDGRLAVSLKTAASFAAVGAIIGAIGSKLPILRAIYTRGATEEAIQSAISLGLIGAFVGNTQAKADIDAYPIKVENVKLKQELAAGKGDKSFAQTVTQEMLEKSGQINRSS